MVTSHKIDENQMGNRGSKSAYKAVKEQRVDGSYFGLNPKLRCTLMGFERSYRVKIPSKQLNILSFSTLTSVNNSNNQTVISSLLHPWFITGFTDAEGTFTIVLDKNNHRTLGWRVQAKFQISLHKRDLEILKKIQQIFNGIG